MTEAYNSLYINDVSNKLGYMLEYASRCGLDAMSIWHSFISSEVARQIERGNPRFLAGYSGREYLLLLINSSSSETISDKSEMKNQESPLSFNEYYWAGSVLAKIQQRTALSFSDLERKLPLQKILNMYPRHHQMDINQLYDDIAQYLELNIGETKLQKIRHASGLSQSELAKSSGVDIRSIQMYEQRRNDINKSQGETLQKLARVLGCHIEDLFEN